MADYIKREDALNASKLVYIECIEKDDGGFLEVDADNIPIVLKRDIMEIPTADVVERKHGKWLEKDIVRNSKHPIDMWQSARCSVCNRYHTTPFSYHFYDYKYCPKCGATMVTDDV